MKRAAEGRGNLRYGMVVAGAGCLMATAALVFLSSSVLLPPLAASLGVGLSQAMVFTSINFLASAAAVSLLGPALTRRFGTRALVIACGGWSGAMLFAVSFVTSLAGLYVLAFASGILLSVANQMSATVLVSEWFVARRGQMLGIVMAMGGIGGVTAGAVLPQVVATGGWRVGFQFVGLVTVALTVLPGLLLIRSTPAEAGLAPWGRASEPASGAEAPGSGLPFARAIRSPQFAALVLGFLGFNAIQGVQGHFTPVMVEHGLDKVGAGTLITLLALVNVGSNLLLGVLSDRFGPLVTFCLAAVLEIVGLVVFRVGFGFAAQAAAILLFALSSTAAPVLTPVIIRQVFGPRDYSALLGIALATMPAGTAVGLPLWGLSYDLTDSYGVALGVAIGVVAVCILLVAFGLVCRPRVDAEPIPTV